MVKKSFHIGNALTEGLKGTVSVAESYSGAFRIEVVPLKKIILDPENPRNLILTMADISNGVSQTDPEHERKIKEIESLRTMAHSIREQGIINPIIVYQCENFYKLVAGERRTLASVLAQKETIPAKILDKRPDNFKISLLQWIENIEREDLCLGERLLNLENLLSSYAKNQNQDMDTLTPTDLSHLIGCTVAQASRYITVIRADHEMRELIRTNAIRSLDKAALILSIQSNTLRKKVVNLCVSGSSLSKLQQIAKRYKIRKKHSSGDVLETRNTRGRVAVKVHFGSTENLRLAKEIFEGLLAQFNIKHLILCQTIDWHDCRAVSQAFKILFQTLETNVFED